MVNLKLTAVLKDSFGNALSGKPIYFYYSYDGETYTLLTTQSTDSDGKAETTHETTRTTWYKAKFAGDDTYDASEVVQKYEVGVIEMLQEVTSSFVNMIIYLFILLLIITLVSSILRSAMGEMKK